jgi:hypothetical protein
MKSNDDGKAHGPPKKREKRQRGTGSVTQFRDERNRLRFKVGITINGRQVWKRLPSGTSPPRADETAKAWAEQAAADPELQRPGEGKAETVADWTKRWLNHREERGIVSIRDDRARMRDHIVPTVGASSTMANVSKSDVKRLVQVLDNKILAGEVSWKAAHHVWTLTRPMFKDACSSKRAELVVHEDDPTDKVAGPDRGDDRSRTYLYPREFQNLIACKDVPAEWRRL